MKRDMDLARTILLEVENDPDASGHCFVIEIKCKAPENISHYVMLLNEAGLLEAADHSDSSGFDWRPKRLTWAGHEFLDAAREQALWEKAKRLVLEKTGSVSFEVVKSVLIELGRRAALGG